MTAKRGVVVLTVGACVVLGVLVLVGSVGRSPGRQLEPPRGPRDPARRAHRPAWRPATRAEPGAAVEALSHPMSDRTVCVG